MIVVDVCHEVVDAKYDVLDVIHDMALALRHANSLFTALASKRNAEAALSRTYVAS